MTDNEKDEMIKALGKRLRTSPDQVVQKVQELVEDIIQKNLELEKLKENQQ